jgi:hypothetical protein
MSFCFNGKKIADSGGVVYLSYNSAAGLTGFTASTRTIFWGRSAVVGGDRHGRLRRQSWIR